MGFKVKKTPYRLYFADGDYEGLEVFATSISVGKLLEIMELKDVKPEDMEPKELTWLLTTFAGSLDSWNVEDDNGNKLPATLDGIKQLDITLTLQIISAWADGMVNIPVPLVPRSPNGSLALTESIPTETLSASLGN